MLLNLAMGTIIDPATYPTTLAVRISTDNRPEFGVRSGKHDGFRDEGEMGQPMPRLIVPPDREGYGLSDLGYYDFIIDRPERCCPEHQVRRYHYVVIAHGSGVYYEYPEVYVLTLQELSDGWSCSLGRPYQSASGFQLILPDYEPGWFARTGAKAL